MPIICQNGLYYIIIFRSISPTQVPIMMKKSDMCVSCGSEYMIVHFQKYCEKCRSCPVMIEEDVKIVPHAYRPNSQEFKLTSVMVIEQHVRDLLNRIDIAQTQANINSNVDKIIYIHKNSQTKRGYKQKCGAYIFAEYEDQHRMTIHQFCKKTGIQVKKFNKKFLEYKRILNQSKRKQQIENQQKQSIKREDIFGNRIYEEDEDQYYVKHEQSGHLDFGLKKQNMEGQDQLNHHSMNRYFMFSSMEQKQTLKNSVETINAKKNSQTGIKNEGISEQLENGDNKMGENYYFESENEESVERNEHHFRPKEQEERQNKLIEQTLQKLYDQIFPSPYLQAIKQKVFKLLLVRILAINDIWESQNIGYPMKQYFRIPCLIFGVIMAYKYKISQKSFIEAVKKALGLSLMKSWLSKFVKMCKQIAGKLEGREDLTQVTSQSNLTCSAINNSKDSSN